MNDSSSDKQVRTKERAESATLGIPRARGTAPCAGAQGGASRQYLQADAQEILKVAGFHGDYGGFSIPAPEQSEYGAHLIVIDKTGVSPNAFIGQRSLLWKPCLELLDGPDTPDANLTPGLPFPFDAPQLAMFMLDGPGAFVTTAFGGWQIEPDRGSLDSMGIYANRAREAVLAAFAAYHQAVGVVGEGHLKPERQEAEAHQRYKAAEKAACVKHNAYRSDLSSDQYRIKLELVRNEVSPLSDQRELAMKRSASARSLWRKAMVKELSRLSALQTEFHSQGEVVADTAVSGGAEPDKTGPGWSLKSMKRAPGYRWPLFQVLKAAFIAGQPCPKARDVLTIWTRKPPPDVQVMPDGLKYNDSVGNQKEADLKAIQQAIKNLMK